MASSSILNIGRTEGTEVPATPTGNVHVSTCSSDLKYRLYPVEVVFPPLDEPWVSDCHLLPKVIDVVFGKGANFEIFEGQLPVIVVWLRMYPWRVHMRSI